MQDTDSESIAKPVDGNATAFAASGDSERRHPGDRRVGALADTARTSHQNGVSNRNSCAASAGGQRACRRDVDAPKCACSPGESIDDRYLGRIVEVLEYQRRNSSMSSFTRGKWCARVDSKRLTAQGAGTPHISDSGASVCWSPMACPISCAITFRMTFG